MDREFATEAYDNFLDAVAAAATLAPVADSETPRIEVDEAIRSIAGFYERTRNTLEYGEADLLRRRAIERSLRRSIQFGLTEDPRDSAMEMLRELIRAGYFPNDELPETIADPVSFILERLVSAHGLVNPLFHDELIRFAVYEIEEIIFADRAALQAATISFVIETCDERLKWPKGAQENTAHRAFLFVAAHKVVLRADETRVLYAFVRDALPAWRETTGSSVVDLIEDFERVVIAAKRTVASPRTDQYARAIRRLAPAFQMLEDVSADENREPVVSELQLERRLEDAVASRFIEVRQKLKKTAFRATLYVLLTKMVIGLGVEIPLNTYLLGTVALTPFVINLAFPPVLMFLVAFSARPPKNEVAERIISDAVKIATTEETLGHAKLPRERGFRRLAGFMIFTAGLGALGLTFVLRGAAILDFTIVDTAIFLIFLSVISLFAWRVRRPLRELAAGRARSGVLWTLVEVFLFPFLAFGRLLADGFRSVNIFLWVLDVFIEAPLKFFFASFEDLIAFLREKREEIIGE